MRPVVVIFALFLVSAVAASRWPASFVRESRIDWQGNECEGVDPGTHVCNYNCTKVLLCRGEAEPFELATCSAPLACVQGECVNGTSDCEHNSAPILCTGRGLFPDPDDCTKYHLCKGADVVSKPQICDHGWAYDPLTAVCSKRTTDSQCTELPIACKELGQSAAFPGNPSIYYVCVQADDGGLTPTLYRCAHGAAYNPSTYVCDDPATAPPTSQTVATSSPSRTTSAASSSSATRSITTSIPSHSPSTSTSPSVSPGGSCYTPREKVPDPEGCYSYYQCSIVYVWTYMECNSRYYFNRERRDCVYGTCPYKYSF